MTERVQKMSKLETTLAMLTSSSTLAELRKKAQATPPGFRWKLIGDFYVENEYGYEVAKVKCIEDGKFIADANPGVIEALIDEIERLKPFEKPPCKHWWSNTHTCWQSSCTGDISKNDELWDFCHHCGGANVIIDDPETTIEEA
jgi:hypothetical protein